jgi:hypothetical protein
VCHVRPTAFRGNNLLCVFRHQAFHHLHVKLEFKLAWRNTVPRARVHLIIYAGSRANAGGGLNSRLASCYLPANEAENCTSTSLMPRHSSPALGTPARENHSKGADTIGSFRKSDRAANWPFFHLSRTHRFLNGISDHKLFNKSMLFYLIFFSYLTRSSCPDS